jgi:allantoicase
MGGEIYLQKHLKPSLNINDNQYDWYYIYREDEDAMTYRYAQATGHPLINEVFSYTPELMHAWINSPTVTALLSSKPQIFSELYPRQTLATTKQHGYERLLMTNTRVRDHLRELVLPSTTIQLPVSHFKVPSYD